MKERRTATRAERTYFLPILSERLDRRGDLSDEELRALIRQTVGDEKSRLYLPARERLKLEEELYSAVRGLDVLEALFRDPAVTEIMVNGPDTIFYEKKGRIRRWPQSFETREKLENVIQMIVGRCNRVINERQPIADARLPDGSRVNAVIAPAALDGPVLTIRRFPDDPITMGDLIAMSSLTGQAAEELGSFVAAGYSILISGGTSAGKTTFLNALSRAIPPGERVITIEDNAELQIQHAENLVRLEARTAAMEGSRAVTISDLIRAALRMRPDRLIIGEVRGGEAAELLQALNTGHQGSLSTIHANSAADTLLRLETLVMMATDIPLPAIRRQIASGIELVVHLERLADGTRRVMEIVELDGFDGHDIRLHPLYRRSETGCELVRLDGVRHAEKLRRSGAARRGDCFG